GSSRRKRGTHRKTSQRSKEGQTLSNLALELCDHRPLRTDSMPRKPQPAPFGGALVIDKPQGKTSHDIVDAVRHLAGFRQVGHLGTLDPLATGVLVLLLRRATGFVQFIPAAANATRLAFVSVFPRIPMTPTAKRKAPTIHRLWTPQLWSDSPPKRLAALLKCRPFSPRKR